MHPSLPDFERNIKINLLNQPSENIRRTAAQFRRFLPDEGLLPSPGSVNISIRLSEPGTDAFVRADILS